MFKRHALWRGLVRMGGHVRYGDAMKNTHRCPKCDHGEVLYIPHVADIYNINGAAEPMRVAHYTKAAGTVFGMAVTTSETAGELSAGVCPTCGYTEFYTRDPENIVVDGTNVQRLVSKT